MTHMNSQKSGLRNRLDSSEIQEESGASDLFQHLDTRTEEDVRFADFSNSQETASAMAFTTTSQNVSTADVKKKSKKKKKTTKMNSGRRTLKFLQPEESRLKKMEEESRPFRDEEEQDANVRRTLTCSDARFGQTLQKLTSQGLLRKTLTVEIDHSHIFDTS